MKIGIIVHSHTGNTYSVAQKLQEKLTNAGHEAVIERVRVVGIENPNNMNFTLESPPDAAQYDALIFGAPVRGFALSPVMAAYLRQMPPMNGKKAAAYATEFLPFDWMGGKNAITRMSVLCNSKGLKVSDTGIIHWKSRHRDEAVNNLILKLVSLFSRT